MAALHHKRVLAGEALEVCESPDPLESCPYEVRFQKGERDLVAKVGSIEEGELVKAAFLCMYQQLASGAPAIIKEDIAQKLLPRSLEVSAPERVSV